MLLWLFSLTPCNVSFDWEYRQAAAAALAASMSSNNMSTNNLSTSTSKLINAMSPRAQLTGSADLADDYGAVVSRSTVTNIRNNALSLLYIQEVDIEESSSNYVQLSRPPSLAGGKTTSLAGASGSTTAEVSTGASTAALESFSATVSQQPSVIVTASGPSGNQVLSPLNISTPKDFAISGAPSTPSFRRQNSFAGAGGGGVAESRRQAIAEMISQIRFVLLIKLWATQ